MKPTEMLKEIKSLLGIELSTEVKVEFARMTLENGTVLEAEEFVADQEVFIVTEEDKIPLPVGEYEMEDGQILVVEEEGVIKEVKAEKAEVEEQVEAAEEMAYVNREEFAAAIDEIKAMIDEVKAGMKDKEEMAQVESLVKEELSATPAATPLKHNPEGEPKKEVFNYANNRALSTRERVLSKLANFK